MTGHGGANECIGNGCCRMREFIPISSVVPQIR